MKNFIYIAMAIAAPIALVNCTKEKTIVEVQKGNTILSGTETPTATLGSVGDYYLRLPVYDFYGPKTAEGWGTPVSLKGAPAGQSGSKIHSGSGAPAADKGIEGDWYIDTVNKRLYGPKTTTGWSTTYIGLGADDEDEDEADQPITAADYELSADGKTLIKWKNNKTKKLDMQADPVLKNVTAIGNYAFEDKKKLITVVLPNNLLTIGDRAFANDFFTVESTMYEIKINIPNKVTHIGKEAFKYRGLSSLILPNSVVSIGEGAFAFNTLKSVVIPNSITIIPKNAFQANAFTTVTIPNSVVTIEEEAFVVGELTSISIPNSVQVIGKSAFGNNKLVTLTVPATVKEIKENAFRNNRLTTITFEGTTPPLKSDKDNKTIFDENRIQHIYVPASSVAAYRALLSAYQSYITAK
jgi:tetratricopeptide repeat protein